MHCTQARKDYPLSVQLANDSKCDGAQWYDSDVVASADQRRKQQAMCGWAEYVAMDLLPAILITKITLLTQQFEVLHSHRHPATHSQLLQHKLSTRVQLKARECLPRACRHASTDRRTGRKHDTATTHPMSDAFKVNCCLIHGTLQCKSESRKCKHTRKVENGANGFYKTTERFCKTDSFICNILTSQVA